MKQIFIIGDWNTGDTVEVEASNWEEAAKMAKDMGSAFAVLGAKKENK